MLTLKANGQETFRQEGHDGPEVTHLSFPDCVVKH